MLTRHLMCGVALSLLGTVGAASTASAQWYNEPPGLYGYDGPPGYPYGPSRPYGYRYGPGYGYGRPLPPDAIVERLEDADYDRVGRPLFNGSTYTVDATAPNGRRVRLVLDAFRGNVLGRHAAVGAPALGPVPEMGSVPESSDRRARAPEPRRREALRAEPPADLGLNPSRSTLPTPADPRLAPRPDGTVSGEERRPAAGTPPRQRREAARPEPGKAESRPAATPKAPAAPPPVTARPEPTKPAEAKADAARSERPVRVIGGVTPMQPSQNPASQLDNLPPPPVATPPTGMN